jgi:hypothetical protein
MEKSWWIRLWAWAAVLGRGFGALVLLASRTLPNTPGQPLLLIFLYSLGFLCFVVSAVGCILWHAVGRPRSHMAVGLRDMLARKYHWRTPDNRSIAPEDDSAVARCQPRICLWVTYRYIMALVGLGRARWFVRCVEYVLGYSSAIFIS